MTGEPSAPAQRESSAPRTRMQVLFTRPGVMSVRFDQAPRTQEGR